MVKQIKAPKTSSAAKAFLNRAKQVSSVQEYWQLVQGTENKAVIEEFLNRHLFEARKELLLEVANLHDKGFQRFRRSRRWGLRFFRIPTLTERQVLKLRDDLRQMWRQDTSIADRQAVLQQWLVVPHPIPTHPRGPFSYIGQSPLRVDLWQPVLNAGRIEPAFDSLPAQLTQGVLEQHMRFAICKNPDCAAPYFIAKRSDQKYCEEGECTAYAQRKYARGYWHRKGKESRQRKVKRKPQVAKRRGK